jgi:hypothetical protein
MCLAIFRWLMSSPKLSHASVIIFLRTNGCLWISPHQFEGGCQ